MAEPADTTEEIELEAGRWLLRLEDEPGDAAMQAGFEAWLAADPRHGAVWRETLHVADVISHAAPAIVTFAPDVPDRRHRWLFRPRAWLGGAVAACALGLVGPDLLLHLHADAVSGTGEVRNVHLADGSMVTLAPASAISVTIADGRRDVRLLRGEAWFDVNHDTAHPFRVLSGPSQTRVLGTAFDVRMQGGETDVEVNRGHVEVSLPDRPAQHLLAGDALHQPWQGDARRYGVRPDRVALWRDGQVVVDDWSVAQVVDALRPWFRGYLLVRGDRAQARRVSGLYDLHDPDAALAALGKAHDVEITRLSPWVRIVTIR